jgi:NTE family protein
VIQNGGTEIYESSFIDDRGNIKIDFANIRTTLFPNFRVRLGLIANLLFNKNKFFARIGNMIGDELKKNLPGLPSLATNNPLYQKLRSLVSKNDIPADTKYMCGFVSIHDGQYYKVLSSDFDNDEQLCNGILASAAMPVVWAPVESISFKKNGLPVTISKSMDGGLRNNSPLGDIIDFINEDKDFDYHIIVINCSSGKIEVQDKQWNIATIALRSLTDIAMEEIFNNDIETFQTINRLVTEAEEKGITLTKKEAGKTIALRKFNCTVINPEPGVLGDTLSTDPALMQTRLQHGGNMGEKIFGKH